MSKWREIRKFTNTFTSNKSQYVNRQTGKKNFIFYPVLSLTEKSCLVSYFEKKFL